MRYFVKAYKSSQWEKWVTDGKPTENLDEAIARAQELHDTYARTVRVEDENERIHFKAGITSRKKSKGAKV